MSGPSQHVRGLRDQALLLHLLHVLGERWALTQVQQCISNPGALLPWTTTAAGTQHLLKSRAWLQTEAAARVPFPSRPACRSSERGPAPRGSVGGARPATPPPGPAMVSSQLMWQVLWWLLGPPPWTERAAALFSPRACGRKHGKPQEDHFPLPGHGP